MEDYFKGLVGQRETKRLLSFHIDSYKKTGSMPHLLAVAAKGVGKTEFIKRTASHLEKPMIELNGTVLQSPKNVFNQVLIPLVEEPYSLFIDEAHEMSGSVWTMFLTLLNPNREHKNSLVFGDTKIIVDFKKTTFLFATTERQLIFKPAIDRLTEVTFDEYTIPEAGRIVALNAPHISVEDEALLELGKVCRGNARSAQKLGNMLDNFCLVNNIPKFDVNRIPQLMRLLGIYPLGLNGQEVTLLKIIEEYKEGVSVGTLTARTNLTRGALQDLEYYLRRKNLILVGKQSLRYLSAEGRNYIKELKK